MKRTTRVPSVIFQEVLKQAEEELALAAKGAANFQHKGIRGDERANALRLFLASHLPNVFATSKGEAIDFEDILPTWVRQIGLKRSLIELRWQRPPLAALST